MCRKVRCGKKNEKGCTGLLTLLLAVVLIAGCSLHRPVVTEDEPVVPPRAVVAPPPAGTIWPGENARNSLFTDNKARHVNDIITIVVEESASGANTANTTTSRDTSTTAGITGLFGLETKILEQNKRMGTSFGVGGSSSNSLTGKGNTSRGGTLSARITARVFEVLPNGNLVIKGRRRMMVNAEDQYIVISGIIRPDDITSDNVISSQYIADAKIVYTGDGVVNDKMRPGWMTRVVDWVWPF